jgi:hypothetical protein
MIDQRITHSYWVGLFEFPSICSYSLAAMTNFSIRT